MSPSATEPTFDLTYILSGNQLANMRECRRFTLAIPLPTKLVGWGTSLSSLRNIPNDRQTLLTTLRDLIPYTGFSSQDVTSVRIEIVWSRLLERESGTNSSAVHTYIGAVMPLKATQHYASYPILALLADFHGGGLKPVWPTGSVECIKHERTDIP